MNKMATILIICISMAVSNASAQKVTKLLSSDDVTKYSPQDTTLGDYYIINFELPEEAQGKNLLWAYLEFYIDVSSVDRDGHGNRTPLLEVYALNKEFTGTIDANDFEESTMSTVRNVVQGSRRRILIDISDIVRSYAKTPSANYGLIMGSLTGARDGIFELKNDVISQGSPIRIIYHFSDL